MCSGFQKAIFSILMGGVIVACIAGIAVGATVDLCLVPSSVDLFQGEVFDLDVWMFPSTDSGGSIELSSAEFSVFWDSPNLLPLSGTDPSLGFIYPFGSYAEWDGINPTGVAHLSATFWPDITLDSTGLLLMSIPLVAGDLPGIANLGFDFFMEDMESEQHTIWLNSGPLDLGYVGASGTAVNVNAVPIPASVLLLGSGIGVWFISSLIGLAGIRRKAKTSIILMWLFVFMAPAS